MTITRTADFLALLVDEKYLYAEITELGARRYFMRGGATVLKSLAERQTKKGVLIPCDHGLYGDLPQQYAVKP